MVSIVIIAIGYSSSVMTDQNKNQSTTDVTPQTPITGRNITIDLNEGLNLQTQP